MIMDNNIIKYKSNKKLSYINKTIAYKFGGNFKKPMEIVLHSFSGGEGTIVFNQDVTQLIEGVFDFDVNVIEVELPASVTFIDAHTFGSTTKLRKVIAPGVKTIEYKAFNDCHELREVELGNDITLIQPKAFENCTKLNNVKIGTRTTLKENIFGSCLSLTNIELSEGISKIPDYMFRKCENLESITLPSTITAIGMKVFSGCKKLKEIYIKSEVPPIAPKEYIVSGGINKNLTDNWLLFNNIDNDIKIYIPTGSLDRYKEAKGWNEFQDLFVEIDYSGSIQDNENQS